MTGDLNTTFGHRHYLYSAALLLFMRRTTIPNSSFLIPHSRKAFIQNQWTEPPKGLTLNPEPCTFPSFAKSSFLRYNLYNDEFRYSERGGYL